MAQFYAEIEGNRGMASRMGSKESGIYGHIRGWNTGARVSCHHQYGRDFVTVQRTGGSHGSGNQRTIAEYCDKPAEFCEGCDHCMSRFVCFTERYPG